MNKSQIELRETDLIRMVLLIEQAKSVMKSFHRLPKIAPFGIDISEQRPDPRTALLVVCFLKQMQAAL